MRGREFIVVADWLASLDSEASLRSQTSRLYYAVYLEARSWCEEHLGYGRIRSAREHAGIPSLLRDVDAEVAASLVFMRDLRNTADYDMDLSPDTIALQCLDAQRRAKRILGRLDELAAPGTDA